MSQQEGKCMWTFKYQPERKCKKDIDFSSLMFIFAECIEDGQELNIKEEKSWDIEKMIIQIMKLRDKIFYLYNYIDKTIFT